MPTFIAVLLVVVMLSVTAVAVCAAEPGRREAALALALRLISATVVVALLSAGPDVVTSVVPVLPDLLR